MHLVTAEQMRRLDRHTIDAIGIPAAVLMENAGREAALQALDMSRSMRRIGKTGTSGDQPASVRWLVLAGKGNNGGDGLAAARHLLEAGIEAEVVYAEAPEALTGDALLQKKIAENLGIRLIVYTPGSLNWKAYDAVMDTLFGTGTQGAPREPYASLIREANGSGLPILAVDVPSGLNADTGEAYDPCIRAVRTVTLAFMKRGLATGPGAEYAGEVRVAPIGIPRVLAEQFGVDAFLLHEGLFREGFGIDPTLPRNADTHKGTYGHVLIAAGSRPMGGAGLMSSKAALRAGCGLVTWALPDRLADTLAGRLPEAMLAGMPDRGTGLWTADTADRLLELAAGKDALVIGPGLGRFPQDSGWLRAVWEGANVPLVVDADALNIIADAGDFASWKRTTRPVIVTPHPGEMARLAGVAIGDVQRDRIGTARRYALQHGLTVVLKGAGTVVAAPDGIVYVNTTGNPGMATGGAGDVLAGVLGSLLAQGLDAAAAAALGVYLHGAAGDRAAAKRQTPASLIAGDIIEEL
ncbi:NAD(P)H-hydrate dehydratase [Ferviditalea candida]|uniref:Bifunctional NAD(P)H-hydrate repair enzyme n=1 Tax=Ferviditalea candida TaxID=3108399 RepID=A0ABU5ZM52_9BACL|nr:NAD(P)H-hydrate dehydratase [Paenibacillaceae bacterium T2]